MSGYKGNTFFRNELTREKCVFEATLDTCVFHLFSSIKSCQNSHLYALGISSFDLSFLFVFRIYSQAELSFDISILLQIYDKFGAKSSLTFPLFYVFSPQYHQLYESLFYLYKGPLVHREYTSEIRYSSICKVRKKRKNAPKPTHFFL